MSDLDGPEGYDLLELFTNKENAADFVAIDLAVLRAARFGVCVAPMGALDEDSSSVEPCVVVESVSCPVEGCRQRFKNERACYAHIHTRHKMPETYLQSVGDHE